MPDAQRTVIVIPGDDPQQIAGSPQLDRLKPYGEVVLHRDRPKSVEEQLARVRDAAVILNSRSLVQWPRPLLEALPNLRMMTVCGIGTDAIDLAAARERGIIVSNIPGKTAHVVAEHALALMLAAGKRLAYHTIALKSGRWIRRDHLHLGDKTLGVIGLGSIGCAMTRLARAIGMNVLAWSWNSPVERAEALGARAVDFDELLRNSDVISLHIKLTPQSQGLIGKRELALMKPGSVLVNTSRGGLVDVPALVEALQSGHLGGAGLDVFDQEPLPADHPILSCEQVVLTPHNADQTPEGMNILNTGAVDNIIAFLEGRPQNVVT
jgi:D-3-phosphoglycerate dehydrogenase